MSGRLNNRIRLVTPLTLALEGVGVAALAVLMLGAPQLIARFLRRMTLIALLVSGALSIIAFACSPKRRMLGRLARGLLALAAAAVIYANERILGAGICFLLGVWALINALVRFMFALQLKATRSNGAARNFVLGAVLTVFAFALLSDSAEWGATLNVVAGAYLAYSAVALFCEAARELMRSGALGRIRLYLPVLTTAFLPAKLLETINRELADDDAEALETVNAPDGMDGGALEIFFHLGESVAYGFGHCDMCLRGEVYSYGSYDESSNRLFGLLSDGVIALAGREKYISYATREEGKTLVAFTVYLSESQEDRLRGATAALVARGEPWSPEGGASAMRDLADAAFIKLRSGPYQIYNALKTNCVALVDELVGEAGIPLVTGDTIVTPGTYYAYLERLFAKPGGVVIRRAIYKSGGENDAVRH